MLHSSVCFFEFKRSLAIRLGARERKHHPLHPYVGAQQCTSALTKRWGAHFKPVSIHECVKKIHHQTSGGKLSSLGHPFWTHHLENPLLLHNQNLPLHAEVHHCHIFGMVRTRVSLFKDVLTWEEGCVFPTCSCQETYETEKPLPQGFPAHRLQYCLSLFDGGPFNSPYYTIPTNHV